jgi:hypothetical protein
VAGLLSFLLGTQPCTQPFLEESLKGVLHHAILRFFLMPRRCDGLVHHQMLLQVLLMHIGQLLLL